MITGYDKEKERGQPDQTFENIVTVIEKLFPAGKIRREMAFRMVGYLVFDAFVGNTDRHHQNWGVLVERRNQPGSKGTFLLQLAPTFDHASSLGREMTDEARVRYLNDGTVERYIRRGRGGIFEHAQAKHGMSPIALATMLAQRYPEFFRPWQTRVANLEANALHDLVGRVPGARMSQTSRTFVLAFLEISRKLLGHAL